jgi:ATP-dependent RNA helicase DDX24/MAK5
MICYLQSLPLHSKTIIFANTIKSCRRMQFFVDSFAIPALNLHSHMQQKQRLKKLDKFKKSKDCNVLIATDVAARGLDFNISHVVQIGVPLNGDTYVHRAGRTARANREGEAFIIVDKKESKRWQEINDIINETSPSRRVERFNTSTSTFEETKQQVEKL